MAELNELKDLQHIIVDSDYTFSGIKKDDSLRVIDWGQTVPVLSHLPFRFTTKFTPDIDPWNNEKQLRDSIKDALIHNPWQELHDHDIIIISDIDEIPRKEAILQFKPEMGVAFLDMQKFGFFLNLREGMHWTPPKIMNWFHLKTSTPEAVRNAGAPHTIDNAGWHFSWCGGIDEVMRKFASFSHQEEAVQRHANREELMRKMAIGESLWGSDLWSPVPISELPQYIQDHQHDSLSHLIFHP